MIETYNVCNTYDQAVTLDLQGNVSTTRGHQGSCVSFLGLCHPRAVYQLMVSLHLILKHSNPTLTNIGGQRTYYTTTDPPTGKGEQDGTE
jgi:hypothetical protein